MRCLHCNESIDDKQEHFFVGNWSGGSTRQSNVVHFHTSCFRSISGNKFADSIRKKGTPETNLEIATGPALDKIGDLVNMKRSPKETDSSLRKRIRTYMTNNL